MCFGWRKRLSRILPGCPTVDRRLAGRWRTAAMMKLFSRQQKEERNLSLIASLKFELKRAVNCQPDFRSKDSKYLFIHQKNNNLLSNRFFLQAIRTVQDIRPNFKKLIFFTPKKRFLFGFSISIKSIDVLFLSHGTIFDVFTSQK